MKKIITIVDLADFKPTILIAADTEYRKHLSAKLSFDSTAKTSFVVSINEETFQQETIFSDFNKALDYYNSYNGEVKQC